MSATGGSLQRLRPVIFWAHLMTGIAAGLVVLVMSVTGVILAYEHQLLDWVAGRYAAEPPSPGAERLPLATLLARARRGAGEQAVVSVVLRSTAGAPVAFGLENRANLFVDPYTGAVLGSDGGVPPRQR